MQCREGLEINAWWTKGWQKNKITLPPTDNFTVTGSSTVYVFGFWEETETPILPEN